MKLYQVFRIKDGLASVVMSYDGTSDNLSIDTFADEREALTVAQEMSETYGFVYEAREAQQ